MERFVYYWERAKAADLGSFDNKTRKKEALEYCGRAFEELGNSVRNKLLAEGVDRSTEAHKAMYWGWPGAHVWKEKHAKLFADFPEEVKLANEVATLRAKFAAAEIVSKPKPKSAKQLKEEAEAKTCQVCGRQIFAEVGVIAHHGYQRPGHGWQTASCYAARALPFEASRDELGAYIAALKESLKRHKENRGKVAAEEIPVHLSYDKPLLRPKGAASWQSRKYELVSFKMTRANAEEMMVLHKRQNIPEGQFGLYYYGEAGKVFEYFLAEDLKERDRQIHDLKEYIKYQQGRYDGWPGQLLKYENGKWVKA